MKFARHGILASLAASLILAACGGGGNDASSFGDTSNPPSSPPPPPPAPTTAEGVYGGAVSGGPTGASAFEGIVLENDDIWAIYGQDLGSSFIVYGFVQGSGTSNNGSYTSSNLRDFGQIPAVAATLGSTYNNSAKTISGIISSAYGDTQFAGGPIPGTQYSYDTAASLASLAGTWTVQDLQGIFYSVGITSGGSFTAAQSGGGCSATGTITPRPSGKNIFDISMTFADSVYCAAPGLTATGIVVSYLISATGQTQLIAAITDSQRTLGTAIFGIR